MQTDKPERATLSCNSADDELMIIGKDWIRFVQMQDMIDFIRDEVFAESLRSESGSALPQWLADAIETAQHEAQAEIESEQRHRQETEAYFRSKR